MSEDIPDKLYFKIGEVSDLVGVKPYVLRYWESEFKDVAPVKSRSNQRLYRKKDVELLLRIKQLLYREKFTINGAKQKIKEEFHGRKSAEVHPEQLDFTLEETQPTKSPQSFASSTVPEQAIRLLKDVYQRMKNSLNERP